MFKKAAGLILCLLVLNFASYAIAQTDAVAPATEERSLWTRFGDWMATVGKTPEEKTRILDERQAERLGLAVEKMGESIKEMKAATSQAAIQISESLAGSKEKVDYLVGQARDMYNSEKFQDTIDVAKHVLTKLDPNSGQAEQLLADAKSKLAAKINLAVDGAQQKLGGLLNKQPE